MIDQEQKNELDQELKKSEEDLLNKIVKKNNKVEDLFGNTQVDKTTPISRAVREGESSRSESQ